MNAFVITDRKDLRQLLWERRNVTINAVSGILEK